MLSVTPTQMSALRAATSDRFAHRLAAHLRLHFPMAFDAAYQDDLLDLIRRDSARARALGFRTERQIADFLCLSVVWGEGFAEREAWARHALAGPVDAPPESRRRRLTAAGLAMARAVEGAR